jgi:hypothetical protein
MNRECGYYGHASFVANNSNPDDAFMVLMPDRTAMIGVSGIARFRKEFDQTV